MEDLRRERRAYRENALRGTGLGGRPLRTESLGVRLIGAEADILALPYFAADATVLQDSDGTPRFMWGLSAFGGSDPF